MARAKHYLCDVGITNHLCGRGRIELGSELFGAAFEHFLVLRSARVELVQQAVYGPVVLAVDLVRPQWRVPIVGGVAGFYVLHALVHVVDTLRGLVGSEHWLIDFPGVYLPALILMWLTAAVRRAP